MSSAKIIGYKRDSEGGAYNTIRYRLLYELTNYFGSKYIGVVVETPI